jgi:hypothetical protein
MPDYTASHPRKQYSQCEVERQRLHALFQRGPVTETAIFTEHDADSSQVYKGGLNEREISRLREQINAAPATIFIVFPCELHI